MWHVVSVLIQRFILSPLFGIYSSASGYPKIFGLENLKFIDKHRPIIFASNHKSLIDPFIIPWALGPFSKLLPIYFLTLEKKYYSHLPLNFLFGGILFDILGGVKTVRGIKEYEISLCHHIELLRCKRNMCIFVEGGIQKGDTLGEAKSGIGYLAKVSGAIVVPVAIKRSQRRTFPDTVIFGKPINKFESGYSYKQIAQNIMSEI